MRTVADVEPARRIAELIVPSKLKNLAAIPLPSAPQVLAPRKEAEISSIRGADGSELAYRFWPGTAGQCVAVYLHGIEGHSQWFENTASVLNSQGITVYAPDRRGSGLNVRARGDLPTYKLLLADLQILLRMIWIEHKGQPLVLIGNCWGARAAAILAGSNKKITTDPLSVPLSGLVLTCPAINTKVDFDWLTKLKIAYYSSRGDRLAGKWPIPLTTPMLTDNPVYLEYIEKDPLRLTEATARFYVETFKLGLLARFAAKHIELPLLILQSGNDQIVDIAALRRWYNSCKTPEKTYRLFPEAVHSLDFDPNCFKEYSLALTEWLLSRSRAAVK